MQWKRGYRSDDVIDRRGQSYSGGGGGGGAMLGLLGLVLRSRFGWAGVIVLLGIYFVMGRLGGGPSQRAAELDAPVAAGELDDQASFVSFVLDDVQATWQKQFPAKEPYRRAKLVLFSDLTPTACGTGETATGPFYCPADERVYIDLAFYRQLREQLGAPGDFAQAYVIAHEVGHHVQNLLGASDRVHRAPASAQRGAEGLSVRLELQADCYAGVWAHATRERALLEAGDIEEALTAAASIGDDRLQKMQRGTVSPETFSHGTSAQRVKWFRRGAETGDPGACDTFAARAL